MLLTGHTGFIGTHLERKLNAEGYRVYHLNCNLLNYNKIRARVNAIKPKYVIHLAAVTTPSSYFEYPIKTIKTNFLATVNLAEACRKDKNLKQFIYSSSVAVYNPLAKYKLDESSPISPSSSHGVAKAASEMYLQYLGTVYGFPFTILRLSNVFGRSDDFRYFIERTTLQMLNDHAVVIENPTAVRDWLYIDDVIEAFVKALGSKKATKEVFLVGSGKGYSTKKVAEIIRRMTGSKSTPHFNKELSVSNSEKIICDNNKAKRLLGWTPNMPLEKGLESTIEAIKRELH